jgi:hypothetical protein
MKTIHILLSITVLISAAVACSIGPITSNVKLIEPSNNVITEERPVSGFSGIDMRTFGQVIISQGDTESLTVKGSDNIVPLVKTYVKDGVLVIEMEEEINFTNINEDNVLTFTIAVKDLSSLAISGLGNVEMESLATPKLDIVMSGAGQVVLDKLMADDLEVEVSGLGNVELAGEVPTARIEIPGAGNLNAPDLKIHSATVKIDGLGNATLWVTDSLTGTINGAGNVEYYGDPEVDTQTNGIGQFKSLGSK